MIKSLHGRFNEVIHNNYTLYDFVYMYAQICDENALIWGFPRLRMWKKKHVITNTGRFFVSTVLDLIHIKIKK
jgi:hypothetical protein